MSHDECADKSGMSEELARRATESHVENYRQLFEKTGNALYVWFAIAYQTQSDLPLPDWCLSYISGAAYSLFWLAADAGVTRPTIDVDDPSINLGTAEAARRAMQVLLPAGIKSNAFSDARSDAALMADALNLSLRKKLKGSEAGKKFQFDPEGLVARKRGVEQRQVANRKDKGERLLPGHLR